MRYGKETVISEITAMLNQQVDEKFWIVAVADQDAIAACEPFISLLSHPFGYPKSDLTAVKSLAGD
jgi:hypothetical protein